jgi:hypothetical protein
VCRGACRWQARAGPAADEGGSARADVGQVGGLCSCGAVLAAEARRRRGLVSCPCAPAGLSLPPPLEYVAPRPLHSGRAPPVALHWVPSHPTLRGAVAVGAHCQHMQHMRHIHRWRLANPDRLTGTVDDASGESAKWRGKLRRPLARLRVRAQRSQLRQCFAALVCLLRGGSLAHVRTGTRACVRARARECAGSVHSPGRVPPTWPVSLH